MRAAAQALGQTKDPKAYDAFLKLVDMPSWHDTIKASALTGLAALGDKRAVELGVTYSAKGNSPQARAAALRLLGSVGKDDPRVFPIVSDVISEAFRRRDFNLGIAAAEALVGLGDFRGLAVLDSLVKDAESSPQIRGLLMQFQSQLRNAAAGRTPAANQQPER